MWLGSAIYLDVYPVLLLPAVALVLVFPLTRSFGRPQGHDPLAVPPPAARLDRTMLTREFFPLRLLSVSLVLTQVAAEPAYVSFPSGRVARALVLVCVGACTWTAVLLWASRSVEFCGCLSRALSFCVFMHPVL